MQLGHSAMYIDCTFLYFAQVDKLNLPTLLACPFPWIDHLLPSSCPCLFGMTGMLDGHLVYIDHWSMYLHVQADASPLCLTESFRFTVALCNCKCWQWLRYIGNNLYGSPTCSLNQAIPNIFAYFILFLPPVSTWSSVSTVQAASFLQPLCNVGTSISQIISNREHYCHQLYMLLCHWEANTKLATLH